MPAVLLFAFLADDMLSNDDILPAQHFPERRSAHVQGERYLAFRVLRDAIECATRGPRGRQPKLIKGEALRWIASDARYFGAGEGFSFLDCCDILDLDPSAARVAIARLTRPVSLRMRTGALASPAHDLKARQREAQERYRAKCRAARERAA